ncbi:bifunctional folylpolyglutamate synthase/dihydrofolate synthase [Harryflintia acetispora]|uniref:bifunctional folylpolyglutamate synthase/dihydrofolate synthase n=1 Tax=Harryflintia acetispora TaxID=1849041 RepID=UPI0018989344|nr:folylpolyglutamate synthase/dihydrofolate synthase family protein [Harryflintia acetispora]
MDYEEALAYIHSASRFKGELTLRRMERLCALLGEPQKKMKLVHVAGTNGKGSTVALISSALIAAGYRTGTFISPYVLDFRERMQVGFQWITKEELAGTATRVKAAAGVLESEGLIPTEFELVTACGLSWFAERGCEVAVLEVGLGGRFDATNVIGPPEVAVITRIALDHTAILGGTLAKIAYEKCGIIKGGDVVCYPDQPQEAMDVIRRQCREKGARLHQPGREEARVLESSLCHNRIEWKGEELYIPLGGPHQVLNALTALGAIEALRARGFAVPGEAVRQGFAALCFPARLELACETPPVLIDGAHNPDGVAALVRALGGAQATVIFSAMQDKDYSESLRLLAPHARRLIACGLSLPRAAGPQEIAALAAPLCPDVAAAPDFPAAFALARAGLRGGEAILVCGSLYLCGEAESYFRANPPIKEKNGMDS